MIPKKESQAMPAAQKTPSTPIPEPAATAPAGGPNPILKTLRSALLIAMGTVAMGKEEVETIVNRLVEKGELAEKDARQLLSELWERGKGFSESTSKVEAKFEELIDSRVEAVLDRLNVPSRRSVEELGKKIAELSQKVDELTRRLTV